MNHYTIHSAKDAWELSLSVRGRLAAAARSALVSSVIGTLFLVVFYIPDYVRKYQNLGSAFQSFFLGYIGVVVLVIAGIAASYAFFARESVRLRNRELSMWSRSSFGNENEEAVVLEDIAEWEVVVVESGSWWHANMVVLRRVENRELGGNRTNEADTPSETIATDRGHDGPVEYELAQRLGATDELNEIAASLRAYLA